MVLESPTSVQIKNSFLITNHDASFDNYWNALKKKKAGGMNSATVPTYATLGNIFGLSMSLGQKCSREAGKRPPARDGHSGIIFNDSFIVFGGDRHHMPFNDMYALDLKTQFEEANIGAQVEQEMKVENEEHVP